MPTYAYKCQRGHSFDLFQKMSDKAASVCPKCGSAAQRQISGGAGLVFKGSGFYITDYKRAGEKKKRESAKDAKSKKKETKPADKSAPKSKSKDD